MAAPQKYAHIDFTPPAGARKQAEQGLKLRREHGRGGTAVGIARARDIANGVKLSPSTVRRMKAFFDRHASDSKAEGFRQGEKGWPSNGVIANKLWGGPAGYSWAKKVVAQMEAADARSTYSLDAETSTIEAGTDRRSSVIPNVERRFLGNFSETEEANPELLRVEERADPETGKKQTYLVGYAARFGKNSLLLGDFVERIAPSAFEIVEKRKDADGKPLETRCLFNHSPDNLLGRFPTTMRMWVDEQGLRYECLLPETRKDIAELVSRGDLKGSSFSFIVAEGGEKWSTEEGRSIRLVTRIKSLLDCGPVTYPAYDSATVAVAKRSYDQFVASKEPTPVVEKRDSGIAARAAEEARKTEEFLAERRAFCPTGDGGGVDNSCGKEESGGVTGAVKSMAKGAAVGAAAGAVTGVGALIGAAAGAVFAPLMKAIKKHGVDAAEKAHYDKLKEKTGITDKDVNKASSILSGGEGKVTYLANDDDLTMEMNGTNTYAFVSSKSHFDDKADGTSLHVMEFEQQPDLNAVKEAARAIGAKNVTFEVSGREKYGLDKKQKESLRKEGHKEIEPGVWKVNLSGSTKKRSVESLHAFLAERRGFCATGPGGGIDNSCGSKSSPSSGPVDKVVGLAASAISAVGDIPSGKTTVGKIASGYAKGATAGGLVGAVGGLGGFIAGSVTGGIIGAAAAGLHAISSSVLKARMDGLKEKMKLSDDNIKKAGDKIFMPHEKTHVTAIDSKTIAIAQGDGVALVSDGSPFSQGSSGTSFHYQPGSDMNGRFDLKSLEGAAKAVKASTVSVEAWHDDDVKLLEAKGYRQVANSVGGYSSSKGVYEKTLKRSKRDIAELHAFLAERRKFCPTGEGGGIDNSCGGGDDGASGGKTPGGTGPIVPKTDVFGKHGKQPSKVDLGKIKSQGGKVDGPVRVPISKLEALAFKHKMKSDPYGLQAKSGQLSGYNVAPKMGYDSGKKSGDYKEWKKGDHLDKAKEKDTQDFLDKARTDQLARGGKDQGKADDGGGVQTWSKGEHFPWTTKQVGTDEGYIQGQHPDGSKTEKYPFKGDPSEAHKKVIEEIKSKNQGFTAKGGVAPIAKSDKPKSLEQIRLEAAGVWEKQQAEKQAAKAKSQQQKSAAYHDEMQPLKDALRKSGVSWGEFATKSNSTAKTGGLGNEKTRKGSYRIAIEELKKGPEAFQAHLSKLGVKPKRSSVVLAEMTAFLMERAG